MIYSRQTIEELYELSETKWSVGRDENGLLIVEFSGTKIHGGKFGMKLGSKGDDASACERRVMATFSLDALIIAAASTKVVPSTGTALRPIACDELLDSALVPMVCDKTLESF